MYIIYFNVWDLSGIVSARVLPKMEPSWLTKASSLTPPSHLGLLELCGGQPLWICVKWSDGGCAFIGSWLWQYQSVWFSMIQNILDTWYRHWCLFILARNYWNDYDIIMIWNELQLLMQYDVLASNGILLRQDKKSVPHAVYNIPLQ